MSAKTLAACATAVALVGCSPARQAERPKTFILVSAASSLSDVLQEAGTRFSYDEAGSAIQFNFGASGQLEAQIEQGAPTDVFISASPREMDKLASGGKIDRSSRWDVAGNTLVLIAKPGSGLSGWSGLSSPTVERIAISNPESVPSGRYAKDTLQNRGIWGSIQAKLILGENVRQTLAYVASGDVDAGIVFRTDALASGGKVRVVASATPGKDHSPITYPGAVLSASAHPVEAKRFLAYLASAKGREVFKRFGFALPAGR